MEQAESKPLLTTEFVTQTVTIVKALPLKTKACFEESQRSLSSLFIFFANAGSDGVNNQNQTGFRGGDRIHAHHHRTTTL
jgi:hypothetical protein